VCRATAANGLSRAKILDDAGELRNLQRLEGELERLEQIHAEHARIVKDRWHEISIREYKRLRSAESDARLALEIARAELDQHKRSHPQIDNATSNRF
jgi:hypothetical protein